MSTFRKQLEVEQIEINLISRTLHLEVFITKEQKALAKQNV